MEIILRQEQEADHAAVSEVIAAAFQQEDYSDHQEQVLVTRLRQSEAFIPELALVAENNQGIIGYILLTRIKIINEHRSFDSLAMAPVAVKPEYQKQGIGGRLILKSHQLAKDLGFNSVVVLGHDQYYPRFGYERSDKYGIELPFDVPPENCMVIPLTEGGLTGISGHVQYPKEFYE
jgi:predicted N-acetyltransferase YhbS